MGAVVPPKASKPGEGGELIYAHPIIKGKVHPRQQSPFSDHFQPPLSVPVSVTHALGRVYSRTSRVKNEPAAWELNIRC
jgi:hypothetical protein